MITINKNYKLLSILLSFTVTACTNKIATTSPTIVVLSHYQAAILDSNNMWVTLLQAYPVNDNVNLPKNCANLYVCKKFNSDEVILLFDLDQDAPRYRTDSESKDIGYSIYKKDVMPDPPLKVTVYLPKNFSMPKGAKYLVGRLSNDLD